MKFTVNTYGWEIEAVGHKLTDSQFDKIQALMEVNGYEELTEVRHDLESESIIADIYDPDLFHLSAPLDNETMNFFILDELGKEVVTFDLSDTTDVYDYFGDDLDPDEEFGSNDHLSIPDMLGCENILLIYDENKGGLGIFEIECNELPKPEDFTYRGGSIGTPEYDLDFVAQLFFKGKLIEPIDYLDNSGKASTLEIFRKDGTSVS